MATQKPERFDQVDWNNISRSRWFDLSINSIGMLATAVPLLLVALSDWQILDERTPTLEPIGLEWDIGTVDYLFIFTLLLFAFYIVLPLFQNPRRTKYYWREFKRNRPAVVSLGWLAIVFVGGSSGRSSSVHPNRASSPATSPRLPLDRSVVRLDVRRRDSYRPVSRDVATPPAARRPAGKISSRGSFTG